MLVCNARAQKTREGFKQDRERSVREQRKKEGRPNRTFLYLRLNLMILIGLIIISQFLNISFLLVFYFILFSFYLFISLLLFFALWLFDFVDLLIRVYYLSTLFGIRICYNLGLLILFLLIVLSYTNLNNPIPSGILYTSQIRLWIMDSHIPPVSKPS